jgi:hypothetical protein
MKILKLISVFLLFFSLKSFAQTTLDKTKIYQIVIETFAENDQPIINETFTRIDKYDIDGNYDKWFYHKNISNSLDTTEIVFTTICVNPIPYSQPVITFLHSKNIDSADFVHLADRFKLDSLNKYISDKRLISWKKAPLSNSALGNVFKKRKATGLSNILFDQQNNIALIKLRVYSKNKSQNKNLSKIIILKKVGTDWETIGSLDEKKQSTAVLQ